MSLRSNFSVVMSGGKVYLKDLGGGMSVTNDAENVLSYLQDKIYQGLDSFVYVDTYGEWAKFTQKKDQDTGVFSILAPDEIQEEVLESFR